MRRDRVSSILERALECRGAVYSWNLEHALATEALLAYERCRRVIADDLRVDPSPATKAVHEQMHRSV
jgi:hypothetical protein